jgi:hypothetical protein
MEWKQKYLKYKNKYLLLKNQIGTGLPVKIDWKGGKYIGSVNDSNQPHGNGQLIQGTNIYIGNFRNGIFDDDNYLIGLERIYTTKDIVNKIIDEYTTKIWVDERFNTSKSIFDFMVQQIDDYKSPQADINLNGNTFKNGGTMDMAMAAIRELHSHNINDTLTFAYSLLERAKIELPLLTPAQTVVFWYNITLMESRPRYFNNNKFLFSLLERRYNLLVRQES